MLGYFRHAWVPVALVACAASVLVRCETGDREPLAAKPSVSPVASVARPDVLLVTIDTLRADRVSALGYPRPTTPHFDALAADGALFESAYTVTPTTLPSHVAMFTSRVATEVGVTKNGAPLAETATTLAERLAAAGYDTGAFVSSYVLHRRFGTDQGFAHYDDEFNDAGGDVPKGVLWEGETIESVFDRRGGDTTDAALAWLASRKSDTPVFLWVHYFDPHQPLLPREPYLSQFARPDSTDQRARTTDAYDAEVRYTDEQLGRLLAAFEARAPGGRGLSIVTSDHGEGLWDHGWHGHGVTLYEELARVPLAFRWPGRIARPLRVAEPVSLLDIAPTIYGLLGLDVPFAELRGRDLSEVLSLQSAADPDRRIFLQRRDYKKRVFLGHKKVQGPGYGVRWRDWKFVRLNREIGTEMFELGADPGERDNVAGLYPEIYDELNRELNAWIDGLAPGPESDAPFDSDVREKLEALGYVE